MGWQDEADVDDFEEKMAARSSKVTRGVQVGAAVVVLLLLAGGAWWYLSSDPSRVVTAYLDARVDGTSGDEYLVHPIIDDQAVEKFFVRGYEVKSVSGSTVSARVIFKSRAGTDLPQTLRFKVKDGKITSID
jgi:hypothetical protein